jgi:hypothetical protein
MAGCLRGQGKTQRQATHSVEALDVGDVLVDEEVHLVGHACQASSTPGPGNKRHVRRRVSDVGGGGGSRSTVAALEDAYMAPTGVQPDAP